MFGKRQINHAARCEGLSYQASRTAEEAIEHDSIVLGIDGYEVRVPRPGHGELVGIDSGVAAI
jgi:hypothetical protein